ncbi:MAG: hypothetical protein JWQ95_456 [Sphaerisporangium sp.]|nr:hypothetical protein [Sphaerisporangium sp.]
MGKIRSLLGCGLLAAILVGGNFIPANAAPVPPTPTPAPLRGHLKFTEAQLEGLRAEGRKKDESERNHHTAEDPRRKTERDTFIAESKTRGITYQPADLDVVELMGTDVIMTVPRYTRVKKVDFTLDQTQSKGTLKATDAKAATLGIDVEADPVGFGPAPTASPLNPTPQFAGDISCPYSASEKNGNWKITILGIGYFRTNWQKCKAGQNSSYQTWVYKRWGVGNPLPESPLGYTVDVAHMMLESYRKPGYESNWLNEPIIDKVPRTTFSQCSGSFYAELSIGWGTAGFPIQNCNDYKILQTSTPGRAKMDMDGGTFIGPGDVDMEYAYAQKIKLGVAQPYWTDHQSITFYVEYVGNFPLCESTNSHAVCNENDNGRT